jgi:hypothetical protein
VNAILPEVWTVQCRHAADPLRHVRHQYSPKYAGSKVNQLVEAWPRARARRGCPVAVDLSDYNHMLKRSTRGQEFLSTREWRSSTIR